MDAKDIPFGATPENIGKVVSVQVFKRRGPDEIASDTLTKYVGVLEAYQATSKEFLFVLRGNPHELRFETQSHYIEIFSIEMLSPLPNKDEATMLDKLFAVVNDIQQTAASMGPQNIRHRMIDLVKIVRGTA